LWVAAVFVVTPEGDSWAVPVVWLGDRAVVVVPVALVDVLLASLAFVDIPEDDASVTLTTPVIWLDIVVVLVDVRPAFVVTTEDDASAVLVS